MSQISWQVCDIFEISKCVCDTSPPKKDDIVDAILSMNIEWPNASWNCSITLIKKNGGAEPAGESEMRVPGNWTCCIYVFL